LLFSANCQHGSAADARSPFSAASFQVIAHVRLSRGVSWDLFVLIPQTGGLGALLEGLHFHGLENLSAHGGPAFKDYGNEQLLFSRIHS
jgi:hypothetical protein